VALLEDDADGGGTGRVEADERRVLSVIPGQVLRGILEHLLGDRVPDAWEGGRAGGREEGGENEGRRVGGGEGSKEGGRGREGKHAPLSGRRMGSEMSLVSTA
jgi:hypothetical protein